MLGVWYWPKNNELILMNWNKKWSSVSVDWKSKASIRKLHKHGPTIYGLVRIGEL